MTKLRNFIFVLKRYKSSSLLNILGLSVAYAAFAIILMQVRYDLNYDGFHPEKDRIFRMEYYSPNHHAFEAIFSIPEFFELTGLSPDIEADAFAQLGAMDYFSTDRIRREYPWTERYSFISPSLLEIFGFEWVSGSRTDFTRPGAVVLPYSMAERMFPGADALGREIYAYEADTVTYTVVGVYQDFPKNSFLRNDLYINTPEDNYTEDWNESYNGFVVLNNPANRTRVETLMSEFFLRSYENPEERKLLPDRPVRLTPLTELHYVSGVIWDDVPKANRGAVYTLLTIGILIIGIAVINFLNFFMALVPDRIRTINTRKILGATERQLRSGVIIESVGISIIAAVISVGIIYILERTPFRNIPSADISVEGNLLTVAIVLVLALVSGFITGIYPAHYITSFPPALVVKGSFGRSQKGKKLRLALISFQFFISILLIICAVYVRSQKNYLLQYEIGLDREHVAATLIANEVYAAKQPFVEKLKQHPAVSEVTFSSHGAVDRDKMHTGSMRYKTDYLHVDLNMVDVGFVETLGLQITEGRSFNETDPLKAGGAVLFNEKARQKYDLKLNDFVKYYTEMEIVGFVEDYHYMPLNQPVEPLALLLRPGQRNLGTGNVYCYIRMAPEAGAGAIDHILNTVREFKPMLGSHAEVSFLDRSIESLYDEQRRFSGLITAFSLIAALLSLTGVFGLVLFETQFRRKETGVRKILGATVSEILFSYNRYYVRIVSVAFLFAAPLAYYLIIRWSENFLFKSPMRWWYFGLSLVLVLFVTIITVTVQSYRSAVENPVNSIKTE